MNHYPSDIGFTPAVKAIQSAKRSRASYAKMEQWGGWKTTVTGELASFVSELDMFYLGTASASGQPYIQYRGGSPGFLKVIDEQTLGFADFAGNQQFISVGNLSENPRAYIFLMDYANRRRIKLWGQARVVEDDPTLLDQLQDPDSPGRVEWAILFEIEAWDINCPQHIHKRFSERQLAPVINELQATIDELRTKLQSMEKENQALRGINQDSTDLP